MRIITKSISLEPFISRFPGVIPAYLEGELYYFAPEDIKKREDMYPSNYGMFPVNLRFSGITDDEGNLDFTGKKYTNYGLTSGITNTLTLSYVRIKEWFYFFKKYYYLLCHTSQCSRIYSSATDYYDAEMSSALYDKSANITHERAYYEELDALFNQRGGVLDIEYNNCDGKPVIVNIKDKGFYKWLCINCFPSYIIPRALTDVYQSETMTYPDVIHWISWFQERNKRYSGKTVDDCSQECDCCDCEEYFRRGGLVMFNALSDWLTNISRIITGNNAIIAAGLKYDKDDAETTLTTERQSSYYPHLVYHFGQQQSVDDMGIMSIFSEEWQPGTNYSGISGNAVVVKNNESFILANKNDKGYKFDYEFLEMVWGNDSAQPVESSTAKDTNRQWASYTEHYVSGHPSEFSFSDNQFYTFNEKGSVVYLKTTGDPNHSFEINGLWYPYNKGIFYPIHNETGEGYFLINRNLSPIERKEYINYNGEKYFVELYPVTNTPFVTINGAKHYGEWVINASGGGETHQAYSFPTLDGITSQSGLFVLVDDVYYYSDGNVLTIAGINYSKLDGYIVDDGIKFYVSGDSAVSGDYINHSTQRQEFRSEGLPFVKTKRLGEYLCTVKPFQVYNASYVSGYTESKLSSLKSEDLYYDDLGNPMSGWYNMSSGETYAQPAEGEELEPYYTVGNVGNLSFLKSEAGVSYYCGDILSAMSCYCVTFDGKPDEETRSGATINNDWGASTLQLIRNAQLKRKPGRTYIDGVYCDITYCVGATLKALSNSYEVVSEGVVYSETVKFVRRAEKFFITPTNANVVYSYAMEQPEERLKLSTYGITTDVPLASFRAKTYNLLLPDSDYVEHNNTMAAPVFRKDALIGLAAGENVNENIYIERGINAAFEQHLKLGEVHTLEALENYGNGAFRMMTN